MIKKLIIENFRSIKNLELDLGEFNAFIGPNNAGKSNIMRALNLILGEKYPSTHSFDDRDFFNYEKTNPIKIEVRFDPQLEGFFDNRIYGFRLTFDGINCEYFAIGKEGNILTYSSGKEVRVSNEMKDKVALMYLGLERQASQQIRPTQWALYGKLLRFIEKQIETPKREEFRESIKKTYNLNIYPNIQEMEDILKTHIKEQTGLDLHLRLSIIDPIETIKNLRPYFKETPSSREFDAEDMGTGTQSALAIAIARAYAEIIRQPLIMAIEEPELYLHPHGCRHFYNLLKNFSSQGIQIIYTTHERSFVKMSDFQCIHLIRKKDDETRVCSGVGKVISSNSDKEIRLVSKFNEEINEVFFANKAVLVEGPDDKIACQLALENLGKALDKESISIIECGSNTAIKPISEVFKFFNIPTYALLDEDPENPTTKGIISELRSFLGNNNVFLQSPNLEGIFRLPGKLTKARATKYFSEYFSKNALVPGVYQKLKERLR